MAGNVQINPAKYSAPQGFARKVVASKRPKKRARFKIRKATYSNHILLEQSFKKGLGLQNRARQLVHQTNKTTRFVWEKWETYQISHRLKRISFRISNDCCHIRKQRSRWHLYRRRRRRRRERVSDLGSLGAPTGLTRPIKALANLPSKWAMAWPDDLKKLHLPNTMSKCTRIR